jgi:hypothetical protein
LLVASLLHGSTASAQGAADTISPTREWQTSSPEDEGYYAPYTPDIPHAIHSSTKAIIGALIAIARKDGLLDRLDHPMLDFSSGPTSPMSRSTPCPAVDARNQRAFRALHQHIALLLPCRANARLPAN